MRAIWSGALSFGLINIPVKLYSASKERALKFKMLEKHNLCPIGYMKICKANHKEVPQEDIVKGYEYEKGDYVVLTDEDFKRANAKKTSTIDIISFTDIKDIDLKYFDKPYYIEPEKKAEKAYVLLREALKRSKKAGIARYVLKEKEHIGILKSDGIMLVLDQLRYPDEIRDKGDLNIPTKAEYSAKELDIAIQLIDQLTEPFNAKDFKDTYTEELQQVIEDKIKGKRPKKKGKEAEINATEITDFMAILKKSLEKNKVS
jgi:DNA end-binding protein Ku